MRRLIGYAVLALLAYPVLVVGLALAYIRLPPVSTLMLGRWVTGRSVERSYVAISSINPILPALAVASEDARFCLHGGVDWAALRDVMDSSEDAGPNRGASTITMQIAKNLFLWPGRSYIRKAMEIPIALVLDLIWSKRRTMEIYLNVAEWGPDGVFGAEAAARRHFKKTAASLGRREAALLVAALPNPILRDPVHPSRLQSAKANTILARVSETPLDCLR